MNIWMWCSYYGFCHIYAMENEDDMLLVIIGNEDSTDTGIKTEVADEEINELAVREVIDTAKTYGELIDFEDFFIKEEPPDSDSENLEEPLTKNIKSKYDKIDTENIEDDTENIEIDTEIKNDLEYSGDDTEYVPEEEQTSDNSDSEEKEKHRYTMAKPWERKSFINDLRQQYPEIRRNKKKLIATLSEIMKNVKPPAPPLDYYLLNGIMLECIYCHSLSETIPAAGRHYQEKHGPRYLICYACGVDFRSTTNLYKHEKRCIAPDADIVLAARALCLGRNGPKRPYPPIFASKPQKFTCDQCPAEFATKNNLMSHEHLHLGIRPYRCHFCPAAYTSRAALSRHIKKHSNIEYICDHCQRSFKVKAALVTHMDTHRPVKRFACDECDKRYAQKFALQLHVDSCHRKLPPHLPCHLCDKRFRRTSVLKEHMKKAHGMELITRKMFYKTLPHLTDTQIKNAKIVRNRDGTVVEGQSDEKRK
ncbi:unnamed protein product [Parnassius apollo]|uniref:(apollo) hypothetical protein n=1 Tax=Parnassius apollo TaxID=110799 RepID=A0A8S3W4L1_PARAO|nr:unnamed protein product [Parnassius apollo]